MKYNKFSGLYTALVTPFNKDKSIDYNSLSKLVNYQIKNKVNGIVILGTTGESPTITLEEFKKIILFVVNIANKQIKIIVGSGSNCTLDALNKSKIASDLGADALLISSPYYNKPSQYGMIQHFLKIADYVSLPIILYNIPCRTGITISINSIKILSKHKNIIGIKESSGDILKFMDLIKEHFNDFIILSGDDCLTCPAMYLGSSGAISVISNIFPKEMKNIINLYDAKNNHYLLYNLMKLLSTDMNSNPVPIKTLMSYKGMLNNVFREPLCSMQQSLSKEIISIYKGIKNV